MALKLNGNDGRLRQADFLKLANTVGIRASDAEAIIKETIQGLAQAVKEVRLLDLNMHRNEPYAMTGRMLDICRAQIAAFI